MFGYFTGILINTIKHKTIIGTDRLSNFSFCMCTIINNALYKSLKFIYFVGKRGNICIDTVFKCMIIILIIDTEFKSFIAYFSGIHKGFFDHTNRNSRQSYRQ